MNKVYALFHNEQKCEMKITNEKHWENQRDRLEKAEQIVLYWNENIYISLSKNALLEKAKQLKEEWLQKQYKIISKIANIELRR
jgi:hypothetical protein